MHAIFVPPESPFLVEFVHRKALIVQARAVIVKACLNHYLYFVLS
jgi:hypothetical protein